MFLKMRTTLTNHFSVLCYNIKYICGQKSFTLLMKFHGNSELLMISLNCSFSWMESLE